MSKPRIEPEQFCYWLQGFFELSGTPVKALTVKQVEMIQKHLGLVLENVTDDLVKSNPGTTTLQETWEVKHPPFSPRTTLIC